jgi:hypothetical protein
MTLTGRPAKRQQHSFTKGEAMANGGEIVGKRGNPWRIAGWSLVGLLLLLPAVAMRFTSEVNWTASDFLFAALLMGGVGGAFELAVRMTRSNFYRGGIGAALAAAFLIVWATGAVGMIGDEGDAYNFLFLAVILVALAGAAMARFRSLGMAWAMLVAGAAHIAVSLAGITLDPRGAVFSVAFGLLWLLSAALFREAARSAQG